MPAVPVALSIEAGSRSYDLGSGRVFKRLCMVSELSGDSGRFVDDPDTFEIEDDFIVSSGDQSEALGHTKVH